MKKIECIIPDRKFAELEETLRALGIRGMTVSDVKGFGREQTRPESFMFLPKTKVEIYCTDDEWEGLTEAISKACQSDQLGSGKIAVLDVHEMIRIRTGERGEVAV